MRTRRRPTTVLATALLASSLALASALPACTDKKDDGFYGNTDETETTEDETTDPLRTEATRSGDDPCSFGATFEGLGTGLLEGARVTGRGPKPGSVTLTHGDAGTATSRAITRGIDTAGGEESEAWFASGFEGGAVDSRVDLDGLWTVTLTVPDSESCREAEPVELTLDVAGD